MMTADQPMIYMTRADLTAIIETAINKALDKALDGRRRQPHDIAVGYKEAQEKAHISESKIKQMRKEPKYRKAFAQDGRKVLVYIDVLLDLMRA